MATMLVLMLALMLLSLTSSFTMNKYSTRSPRTLLSMADMVTHYEELSVSTNSGVSLVDITKDIADIVAKVGCEEGVLTILSKHSTVSVTINEMEGRLVDDTRQFLLKLAPPAYPYLHNDLDYRYGPSDWPGGDVAWRAFRATQPVNTHSHLIAMMLGTSESIPIHEGLMKIGKYQNIIIVDADGPKTRSIAVQITGTTNLRG
jgi:thiamine phosphate synthase YjbQ (UPF0047 family)